MAEAFLNPAFSGIRGRVGSVVFYSYNATTYFRAYVRPRNPDTPAQRINRGLFGQAMKAWQSLPSFDRESFSRRGRRLGMTGHNLFISRYLRSKRDASSAVRAGNHAPRDDDAQRTASSSYHSIGHSVIQSLPVHCSSDAEHSADIRPHGG